jgi:transposase
MRGDTTHQARMIATTPEQLVPHDHPIRRIKPIVDGALAELSPLFEEIYSRIGRPSIPPEHLLKAQLLMALFSVPSARRFCDQLQYNMLFKWFLDLNVDDSPFHASTFSKNQERLLSQDVARRFLLQIVAEARRRQLLSEDHFSVDGTLLDAWASKKSVRPYGDDHEPPLAGRGKNPNVNYRGQRLTNDTHRSTTDPDARFARKGDSHQARLCFAGHLLMEHRSGLAVDVQITRSQGDPEWEVALRMLDGLEGRRRRTVAGDRAYDARDFVAGCRARRITPHVAQYPTTVRRKSAIDGRTTRHPGYRKSQRWRKRVEEIFGWLKTVGGGGKLRFIGLKRNQFWAELTVAAYNLVRMAHIAVQPGPDPVPA